MVDEALRKQLESLGIDASKLSCGSAECIDLGVVIHGLEAGGCGRRQRRYSAPTR